MARLLRAKEYETDIDRLATAVMTARRSLETYRSRRREMVRQYAGANWGNDGAPDKVYLNLLALYVQVVSRALIAKNPRVMLSAEAQDDAPAVHQMQEWANGEIEDMYLADTLLRVVYDGLFSVGIVKVALAHVGDAQQAGWNVKAGHPFAERVDLEDFVCDMHARNFSECAFLGHRYKITRAAARSRFGKKIADRLPAAADGKFNHEGDERIGLMGRGSWGNESEFEDYVTLWELYLPRTRRVLTISDDFVTGAVSLDGEALDDVEWLGHDCGPYHFLGFNWVPGNPMPKGPVMDLFDLHMATNRQLRKLIRQGDRMKQVGLAGGGAVDDAARIQKANDGDIVECQNPDLVQERPFGGPDPKLFQLAMQLKEFYSWAAGNLDLMGGLSPQSRTAAQDKMLNENSSRSVADMQDTTVTFTSKVLRSLCWYWWNHPQQVMKTTYTAAGVPEIPLTRRLTPQRRQKTSYSSMRVKVDPYSLQHATPQGKAQTLNALVQQTIVPLLGVLQQQGVQFDAQAFLAIVADYTDMPEIKDILTLRDPPQAQPGGGPGRPESPGMPANTNRTYTRENVSGTSTRGNDVAAVNAMAGTDSGGDPNA